MTTTKHFTELQEFAVKDKIERGAVYIYCHPNIAIPQAYYIVALSALVTIRRGDTFNQRESHGVGNPDWDKPVLGFWSMGENSSIVSFDFASDAGVVGGCSNFILDKNDLLRRGISVDLSPLDLLEPV